MGRTLPSITQAFLQEQAFFSDFRRGLRRSDQTALDELFAAARQHLAAAAFAANPLPFETFLLAMLLEEHKEVVRLRQVLISLLPMDMDIGVMPAANVPVVLNAIADVPVADVPVADD
jgi:hypothetical protein